MISPIPTVRTMKGMAIGISYTNLSTIGTMIMFDTIGGIGASHGESLRSFLVKNAPISVAIDPKITSQIAQPVRRFERKHPTKSPGMAAGVKYGRMVSASEKRTWMAPLDKPKALQIKVNTT